MSLHAALDRLPGDRTTESTVREVLELMRLHVDEPLDAEQIADRLGRPGHGVRVVLSELAESRVVRRDGDRFRYMRDPIVDLDIERFLRRARQHTQLVQDNVAKFRDRFGQR